MEKKEKNTNNFLIYSNSGMMFNGSKTDEQNLLTDDEISQTVFGGNKIGQLELNYESFGLTKEDAEKEGFIEKVLVYFSLNQNEVWNYNPYISVHIGNPIYSPVILFITPSMLKDWKGSEKDKMDNETFVKIVNYFIESSKQYTMSDEGKGEKEKITKSSKFQLSNISYIVGNKCRVDVDKSDINNLDKYWAENFTQVYHPDFCWEGCKCTEIGGKESKKTVLIKAGMMTLLDIETGEVENYFAPQYNSDDLFKVYEEIGTIYQKYNSENIGHFGLKDLHHKELEKKRKEEINKIIHNYHQKIGC